MKGVPITLFSFASEFYSDSIAKTFLRLGYLVNIVKAPDFVCVSDNIYKGIEVFLFGESIHSQNKICSLLTRANNTARYGIFVNEKTGLDVQLVDHLNEFSSWPCSDLVHEIGSVSSYGNQKHRLTSAQLTECNRGPIYRYNVITKASVKLSGIVKVPEASWRCSRKRCGSVGRV